jgi:hypothetical protein
MLMAKVENGEITLYPYTFTQLRADNPCLSLPTNPSVEVLAAFNAVLVTPSLAPTADITQIVSELTPVLQNGEWVQVWEIRDATPDELKARLDGVRAELAVVRAQAYRNEADPLFFKAQRGEATLAEWEAVVDAIRARYPYPET